MNFFNYQFFKSFCIIYLFLIITLLSQGKSQAQVLSENTKFKHLSVDDGLSDNNVSAILQDKEGFMWFGTGDGLNKYDGYKFTVYRHNPNDTNSIGPGNITSIIEDKEGFIWIGTSGSLSILDKKTGNFKVYKNEPKNPNSLSHNLVNGIIEGREGDMWISTYGGGLNKFDKKTGNFLVYKNDPKDPNSIDCNLF
jgi:ligand-binding sensor domain-containing protein